MGEAVSAGNRRGAGLYAERSDPVGPEIEIPKGTWHEIAVECKGNRIRCLLNGKEAMKLSALNRNASSPRGIQPLPTRA